MELDFPLVIVPFILMALAAMFLAGEAWQHHRSPGSLSFVLLMLGVCIWLAASGGGLISAQPVYRIFWAKAAYFAIAWLPTLWLAFALELSTQNSKLFNRYGWTLWIMPSITIMAVVSNDAHHWFWTFVSQNAAGGMVYGRGPLFWVTVAYNYLLLASASMILARGLLRFPAYHRRQVAALVIGMLLPWVANLSFLAGWIPQEGLDLTPYTFAITGILFAWTLYRIRLFDPVPLAREVILEQLVEGYLALDMSGRILDANPVAQRMLSLDEHALSGGDSRALLKRWPALLDLLQGPTAARLEFCAAENPRLFLEASLSNWSGRGGRSAGKILILHDITRRKAIEEELRESEKMHRLLVNSLPLGIATIDLSGTIQFASPEMIKLFGIKDEAGVTGQKVIEWLHPDDRRRAAEGIRKVLHAEDRSPSQMFRMVKANGQVFWGDITSARLMNEQDEVRGMLSIIRDVTQQRELKLQLQNNLERQTLINGLLQLLYGPQSLGDVLGEILELVGYYFHASRVTLCQDSREGDRAMISAEWARPGLRPRSQETALLIYAARPSWRLWMETRGRVIVPEENGNDPTIPFDLVETMDTWNVLSLAAVPVFGSEKSLYGFLGLEDNDTRRAWESEELETLGHVARFLSSAVAQKQVEEAQEQSRLMTEALQDTARVLTSTLNLDEVLDHILANLEKVVPFDSASIAMINAEDQEVSFVRWRGYDPSYEEMLRNFHLPLGERATYRTMALTGKPMVMADTFQDPGWVIQPEYNFIRSYAGAPIKIKDQVVGFINLDSREPDYFTQDVVARLIVFADQAAVAIGNARLYQLAHQRAEQMGSLYRISLNLTSGLEMDRVLSNLFGQCCQMLPIDVFYVLLYDAEKDQIHPGIFYKEGEFIHLEACLLAQKSGITWTVIHERRTVVIPDAVEAEARGEFMMTRLGGQATRAYVAVPLIMFDQVVGVISMQSFQPSAYTDEQVRLLETIAVQAAVAVHNARLYEQMRQMAITDTVTQLFTRRHFTVLGRGEIERAQRYHHPVGVLMVDIDLFKKVNDTYGHFAGDLVLQAVARTCSQTLRSSDLIGRWGGEEFTILLPETDPEAARLIAERIRSQVEDCEICLPEGSVVKVTISLGLATDDGDYATLEGLVDCADRAMYAAKQAGRNQVKTCEDLV